MEKYYDDWVKTKIPTLGNITPEQAIMTKSGRDKVKALIDDFENFHLHIKKNSGSGNGFRYYNQE